MPSKYVPKNTSYLHQSHSGKKAPPTGTDADLNLATLTRLFYDETAAREWLESKRWSKGRVCPHCASDNTYKLTPKPGSKSPVRPGVYKCGKCRSQFTVRVGTIFEDSKLPISKWLMAMHLMTSSKKGISSHQIARELDITVKSAWFLTMRIREAMRTNPIPAAALFSGPVEIDEAYIGPRKPRVSGTSKRGRGTQKKPVVVLVERNGRARCMPVERVDGATLRGAALTHVSRTATILTDELNAYTGIGAPFSGGHHRVNHSLGKYATWNDDGLMVSTNTAESFFALLKRGHIGAFHHFSRKHTHRYCDEFSFRWDYRKVSDGERMVEAIRGAEGKRLMYREPVADHK